MVGSITKCQWGFSTKFTAALQLILDQVVLLKLPSSEVEDMVLVVFSDMQIDSNGNESITDTMYKKIERMYYDAGIKVNGTPYTVPHILFWNLRPTNGFPNISTQRNTSMMSGFSPALLNNFCEKGMEALKNMTPWVGMIEALDNPRYNLVELNSLTESL